MCRISATEQIQIANPGYVSITLEHARTTEQIQWGLMQRQTLPKNAGMTFFFPYPYQTRIWMFNTQIDLSIAFLDKNRVIKEIRALKAFPEMMDLNRPVRSVEDLALYPSYDPIFHFFVQQSIAPSFPATYALEMNKDWFTKNSIKVGDVVVWQENQSDAVILRTLDLTPYLQQDPVFLTFDQSNWLAVTLAPSSKKRTISFYAPGQVLVYKKVVKNEKITVALNQPIQSILLH